MRMEGELTPDFHQKIIYNPFYILGLRSDSTKAEVEQRARWLLDRLAECPGQEETYTTPLGRFPLTRSRVDEALHELEQPSRRLMHEVWAHLEPGPEDPPSPRVPEPNRQPFDWSRLRRLVGW